MLPVRKTFNNYVVLPLKLALLCFSSFYHAFDQTDHFFSIWEAWFVHDVGVNVPSMPFEFQFVDISFNLYIQKIVMFFDFPFPW